MAADSLCAPLAGPASVHLATASSPNASVLLTTPRHPAHRPRSRRLWPIAERYEANRLFGRVVSMEVDTASPQPAFRMSFATPPAPMSSGWNAEVGFCSIDDGGRELFGLNAVLREDRRWHAVGTRVDESGCSIVDHGVVLPSLVGRDLTFRFPPGCSCPRVDVLGATARTTSDLTGRWLRWTGSPACRAFEGSSVGNTLVLGRETFAPFAAGAGR